MVNAENGSEPILCICITIIINTLLKLIPALTPTQTLRMNKALGMKSYFKEMGV